MALIMEIVFKYNNVSKIGSWLVQADFPNSFEPFLVKLRSKDSNITQIWVTIIYMSLGKEQR